MWYNTWWGAEIILLFAFAQVVYMITLAIDLDVELDTNAKYFVRVLHKPIWVKIAKSERLNKVGKIVAEIFVSTFLLPAIVILYITGLLASVFGYIGSKLFFKESK